MKDFGITKDGGKDQGVCLFVIQGMKERIKQEFLNKRQQQVEDEQRQQQELAQQENYRKQMRLPTSGMSHDESVLPSHVQHHYNAQNQGGYGNRVHSPNPAPPQNMGAGFYQDQRPMQRVDQPPLPQPQQHYHPQQRAFVDSPAVDRYPGPPRDEHQREYQPKQEPLRAYQPVHQPEMQQQFNQPSVMRHNNPPRGAAGGIAVFPVNVPLKKPANEGPPPVAPRPFVGQPEKPTGWNCEKCTFLNEPFRPGCKMCGAQPPENYEPPANHVPSADELKFIQEVYQ